MNSVMLMCPSDFDIHLFHEGQSFESYRFLGAHVQEQNGVLGTNFCVWAPHARQVNVVGNFNKWNGQEHQMKKLNECFNAVSC